jgi:hypothetical protein
VHRASDIVQGGGDVRQRDATTSGSDIDSPMLSELHRSSTKAQGSPEPAPPENQQA